MVSLRSTLRSGAALAGAALAIGSLGACDLIIRAAAGDRHLDPHVSCDTGECVCTGGFDDCDGDVDNGCESSLSTTENCGACGVNCGKGTCLSSSCICPNGFTGCNSSGGCETDLMNDAHNCGACGVDCGDGVCSQGVCQLRRLAMVPGAESLILQGTDIYVGLCGMPPVVRVPEDGGGPFNATMGTGCAHQLSVGGSTLFWTDDAAVQSMPLGSGSGPSPIAPTQGASPFLAASMTHVYWWDNPTAGMPSLSRTKVTGGGMVETVAPAIVTALVADDANAYWSDEGGLHAIAHYAMASTTLSNSAHATALALTTTDIYAADEVGIERYPITGGAPVLVSTDAKGVSGLAVDDRHVYWASAADNTLRRSAMDGSEATVLATGQMFPKHAAIALDQLSVFWVADGEARKIVK
jgi:hypothetical protein